MSEQGQQGTDALDVVTKLLQQANVPKDDPSGGALSGLDLSSLLGGMSTTVIVINFVAGIVGAFYFMYGRRRSNIPMITSGILLCIVPLFISNVYRLSLFCLLLLVSPYLVERYMH